jgi:CRISPR/Cas system-associated protein Cas10 (large subunit of type III CRISPR-Cas system)
MLRIVEAFNTKPELLREFLYTGLHCEECALERKDRWGKEWVRQELAHRKRLLKLRAMPYEEYLQTPHWKRRREDRLRAAGRRCQLCNRGSVTLNVHHRTYERLGEELDGDLIVLCRTCHSTFHEHRRLER